jgi:hypothetical protein
MLRRALIVALGLGVAVPAFAQTAASATVTCKDGSTSKAGKGACSHHGGVAAQAPAQAAPPVAATPPATKPAPAPTAGKATPAGKATAKCKDGSLSYAKVHTGACSHHGGVAQWL